MVKVMTTQWAKSPKKQSEGVLFVNSALKIQCLLLKIHCYFFGDFDHWGVTDVVVYSPVYQILLQIISSLYQFSWNVVNSWRPIFHQ